MSNRFNLIDEPWIPVVDTGMVSLRQIFENPGYRQLGGNPVEKIALMKLLLAIAQAASTPQDESQWCSLGAHGLALQCLEYLNKWHDRFYLFGEQPFLQVPAISAANEQSYGAVCLGVSSGNTTILSHSQIPRSIDDADKARVLITQMSMALGGKKTDNSVTLSPGYTGKVNPKGKPASSRPGPAIGFMGYLHSFVVAENLLGTLWLNLLTHQQITKTNMFAQGLGVAPWELMPSGEDCQAASALKSSLMGRLVPLCRFCLLTDNGLHYSEGLRHTGYKEGMVDPTVAMNNSGKDLKVLWANPDKRPWRELTALLSFLDHTASSGFQNLQVRVALQRLDHAPTFAVWSGGLRVSSNAGEQYTSGTDDFVESFIWLERQILGENWFRRLKAEMDGLADLSKILYGRVSGYFAEMKGTGDGHAARATNLFWQLCERDFQGLVLNCDAGEEQEQKRIDLRRRFAAHLHKAYDQTCPSTTAKQIDAWAKHRPHAGKYLKVES